MDYRAAARLIAPAVDGGTSTWADLGAGWGTFTRALASLLGPGSTLHAVERDAAARRALDALSAHAPRGVRIVPSTADFVLPLDLPPLDGALFANALHFVPPDAQFRVLCMVRDLLRHEGRLVIVEYDDRPASRWVPHPIPAVRFAELAEALGMAAPVTAGTRRSDFGGVMYAAWTMRRR